MERIDDCLSIRAGRLFIEDCDTTAIARQFGTPLYVISEDQLRRNARRLRSAFAGHWPYGPVRLLPSIKANHCLALRWILTSEGTGCDTFGAGELRAALQCGVPPDLISVNGSVKDRSLLEHAIKAGTRLTLDSAAELQAAREVVADTGVPAAVRLRVRPAYTRVTATTDFLAEEVPIGTALQAYKVGIPTEQLATIDPVKLAEDGITVTGLMTHFGRHSRDLRTWNELARGFADLIADLCSRWPGWAPRELDNRWFVRAASKAGLPPAMTADIVGKTCQPDIIVPGAQLPHLQPGDVLAVLDTGAYQDACASNFNAVPRPGTVLVHDDNAELVRRAETLDDLFRRDIIPERLKNGKLRHRQADRHGNATDR